MIFKLWYKNLRQIVSFWDQISYIGLSTVNISTPVKTGYNQFRGENF